LLSHDEGVQEIALTALKAAPEERVHFALARHWTMLILRAWSFPLASKLYQGIHMRFFARHEFFNHYVSFARSLLLRRFLSH
jgi:hypothetical protein